MVDGQVRPSDVTRTDLIDAMLWAPRERFVPKSKRALAYMGEHIELSQARWELDPRVLAKMIETLEPEREDLALVIGSGGGYAAAILSKLCAAVVALESDAALASASAEALREAGCDTVIGVEGPLAAGAPAHAPYNLVLVNGAVARDPMTVFADVVASQVADAGRLVCLRLEQGVGRCEILVKSGSSVSARRAFDASAPTLPGFEAAPTFEF